MGSGWCLEKPGLCGQWRTCEPFHGCGCRACHAGESLCQLKYSTFLAFLRTWLRYSDAAGLHLSGDALVPKHSVTPLGIKNQIDVILMENLGAKTLFKVKNFTVGEHVPGSPVWHILKGISYQQGRCFSVWVPENHYSWLESLFLCFKFSFFLLLSLSIFEAEQPNVGNYQSLGDTGDVQMVFMFFGTVEIWLMSFSRNSWIFFLLSPLSLCSYEKQVWCLGGRERDEESKAGKQKMNLFCLYLYFILPS